MKTFYFGFFGLFALTYLTYLTWLTGYQAGYDEGAEKAWTDARQVFMSPISENEDFTPASTRRVRPQPAEADKAY